MLSVKSEKCSGGMEQLQFLVGSNDTRSWTSTMKKYRPLLQSAAHDSDSEDGQLDEDEVRVIESLPFNRALVLTISQASGKLIGFTLQPLTQKKSKVSLGQTYFTYVSKTVSLGKIDELSLM